MELVPLRFEPIFRRYVWGGRRLHTLLGKPIGPEHDYAESWEIVDRDTVQSVVECGLYQGRTLGELCQRFGAALLGRHSTLARFPLLFKFLDANRSLSVQVHPNDSYAAKRASPDLGKTEAWVILHADPGSAIYAGLNPGCDRRTLEEAIRRGTTESCLHRFEPRPGDCVFLPAGTVHALGSGLVVAEVQQSSDLTYRLFDWNRAGSDGLPRPLHVREALEVIDFVKGPVLPQNPRRTDLPHVERLVCCEHFVLDRWCFAQPQALRVDDRFHLTAVIDGEVHISGDRLDVRLGRGDTALLPASSPPVVFEPTTPCTMLDVYLP